MSLSLRIALLTTPTGLTETMTTTASNALMKVQLGTLRSENATSAIELSETALIVVRKASVMNAEKGSSLVRARPSAFPPITSSTVTMKPLTLGIPLKTATLLVHPASRASTSTLRKKSVSPALKTLQTP